MPNYFFQQKINTIAELWQPFEHNGFRFEAHGVDMKEGRQRGWMCSKEISAEHVDAAFQEFFTTLYPLIDKVSFVTQCFAVMALEPYLIKRTDQAVYYLQHTKPRGHVPLHFGTDELTSLEALERYEQKGDPFRYLHEAINAPDFYTRLAMLASALEAIAGEKTEGKTNHDDIKGMLLKDESLHAQIFGGKTGLRNQLLHGKKIDDKLHGRTSYNEIIYSKIINYFNVEHGTKIDTGVVGAPRTIGRSYSVWRGWLEPRSSDNDVDLSVLCELSLDEATKDSKTIEKPSGY